MRIAVSKGVGHPKYLNYGKWLRDTDSSVEVVELSELSETEALQAMQEVDGLMLTGGNDIHPKEYNKPELESQCANIDVDRDRRERAYLKAAEIRGIPVVGICRGMQMMNIAHGGTLIADIHTTLPETLDHRLDDGDASHKIFVEAGSHLAGIAELPEGMVNSSHHQTIDKLGIGLRVTARSSDNIVEALEGDITPYFLGVQWHPERMDRESPFSRHLVQSFLTACR